MCKCRRLGTIGIRTVDPNAARNVSQVLADGQEVGAYMFRRTLAAVHLTPEDVRWMVSRACELWILLMIRVCLDSYRH